jgi:hypothetical protein
MILIIGTFNNLEWPSSSTIFTLSLIDLKECRVIGKHMINSGKELAILYDFSYYCNLCLNILLLLSVQPI